MDRFAIDVPRPQARQSAHASGFAGEEHESFDYAESTIS
jgi:hypothetical protein